MPMTDEGTEETKKQERVSFSVDPTTRRNIRIAAAVLGMEVGEWMSSILSKAASEQVKKAKLG